MKIILRIFGLVGVGLFATFFYFTYSIPGYVEEVGKDFIKSQIQTKTNERIDDLKLNHGDGKLAKLAGKLYEKNQQKIDALKGQLKNKSHERLAVIIAEMRNLDCECRRVYAEKIKQGYESQLSLLENANERLQDFMKTKYMEVATELKRDVRIFTGSNTLIFLALLLISFLKPRAINHLFLPGVLLIVATLVCSFFYIFEQNWLFNIIYNDYLGYSYLGYVGIVVLFLCDIVFNSARITTEIINAMFSAIGSVFEVAPC